MTRPAEERVPVPPPDGYQMEDLREVLCEAAREYEGTDRSDLGQYLAVLAEGLGVEQIDGVPASVARVGYAQDAEWRFKTPWRRPVESRDAP